MEIIPIKTEQCLDIRHQVLWPNLSRNECRLPGDEEAKHYGLFVEDKLVSCLSLFVVSPELWQIRKFATLTKYQNQGYGTFLLTNTLQLIDNAGVPRVCLEARQTAVRFYQKVGFQLCSDTFLKHGIEYRRMQRCSDASLQ